MKIIKKNQLKTNLFHFLVISINMNFKLSFQITNCNLNIEFIMNLIEILRRKT
jgi:hypothetical protein